MALDPPGVAVPPQAAVSIVVPETASFDERWAAWLAKGAADERAFNRKMAIVAPVLIAVGAGILYVLLGR